MTVHATKDIPKLPEEQAILLFQAVRELLINVVKHAATEAAWVTVDVRDANLVLSVRDEGAGFDAASLGRGPDGTGRFGLFSLRERVEAMGGEFDVRAILGQGTECTISLPLAPDGNEGTPAAPGGAQRSPVA